MHGKSYKLILVVSHSEVLKYYALVPFFYHDPYPGSMEEVKFYKSFKI